MKAGVIIPWEKVKDSFNTSIIEQFLTTDDDYELCFVVPSIAKTIPSELKAFTIDNNLKSKVNIIYRSEKDRSNAFTKGVKFFSTKSDISYICILEEFSFSNTKELEEELQLTYKTKNIPLHSRFSVKQFLFKFSLNMFL
ncbi:hypothetical protein SAMN05216480_107167 [Pustulibacterium marinum]|uniref:Uncharacterized protein n=1 Tax=Pustulibacterium marinum TaxID=1224947 RepID=A0A1I7H7L0_9FLAO|nr:hypothetical protein [Pustulibacterium marinum]SFU56675.1 hypothetical protein SAMN05216480_107167 [Pustulibacterium marinum]